MSCIDKIVNDPVMVPADLCRQGQPLFMPIFILTPYISEASRTLNKPLKMERGGLRKVNSILKQLWIGKELDEGKFDLWTEIC